MKYCDAHGCGKIAGERKDFRDPKKDTCDKEAYIERYFCSPQCEKEIQRQMSAN